MNNEAAIPVCAVVAVTPAASQQARRIAGEIGCELLPAGGPLQAKLLLMVDTDDLWLQRRDGPGASPVRVDFAAPTLLHRRRSGHNELLGRAVGVKSDRYPLVFDATAGLGRDAYVLADLGCTVWLVERSPVLALLLQRGLDNAAISQVTQVRNAASQMSVQRADSCQLSAPKGAVIYLDPMFTARRGRAAVKKDLDALQLLHEQCRDDGPELFDWALAQPASRIVVKRPLKGPALAELKPSHTLKGKAIRFDVYVRPEAPCITVD